VEIYPHANTNSLLYSQWGRGKNWRTKHVKWLKNAKLEDLEDASECNNI
jgi:hypothetical protein